jgi:hypothetical protein
LGPKRSCLATGGQAALHLTGTGMVPEMTAEPTLAAAAVATTAPTACISNRNSNSLGSSNSSLGTSNCNDEENNCNN